MPQPRPPVETYTLPPQVGGLNKRDAPSEVKPNEAVDCLNVTIDERGGITSRLGQTKDGAMSALPANIVTTFYWKSKGWLVVQAGARLWARTGAGTYTEIERAAGADAFTTSDMVGMCEFKDVLVVAHPVDGMLVATTTGSGGISVVAAGVKARCCVPWQNKVWAGGAPAVADQETVYWSNEGNASVWTTATDFNVLREGREERITAMGVAQGDGVVVFKENAQHFVYDSTTGFFRTRGADLGVVGPQALVPYAGRLFGISKRGLIVTDGLDTPVLFSDLVEPLFHDNQLALGSIAGACAGIFEDRLLFSVPQVGVTYNSLTLEYDPELGWIVPHSFGLAGCSVVEGSVRSTFHGKANGALIYETFSGGTDDGTAIHSYYQTAHLPLGNLAEVSLHRVRAVGSGNPDLYVVRDWAPTGDQYDIDWSDPTVIKWGTIAQGGSGKKWGDGSQWGVASREVVDDVWGLDYAKALSFKFDATTTATRNLPAVIEGGGVETVGAWSLYGMRLEFTRLGLA